MAGVLTGCGTVAAEGDSAAAGGAAGGGVAAGGDAAQRHISAREVGRLPPSLAPTIGSGSVLHRTVRFDSRVLADCDAAAADSSGAAGAAQRRAAQQQVAAQLLLIFSTTSSPTSTTAFAAVAAAGCRRACLVPCIGGAQRDWGRWEP